MTIKSSHRPRKRFGQNFLQDPHVIQEIIQVIHPSQEDHLVEIGPGLGALTSPLLLHVSHLDVIEIDRDLAQKLHDTFPRLSIHTMDVLKFDFNTLFKHKKLRIIGNLPYNISTPLIFHLLKFSDIIQDMYFMLQKEVIDRLVASPNNKQYGRLSIMAQYFYETTELLTVEPSAFFPVPKVYSGIIRLKPRATPLYKANDLTLLREVVTTAFNQRRKTIANSLKHYLNLEDFNTLKIDPSVRPETLSIQDYVQISNYIALKGEK